MDNIWNSLGAFRSCEELRMFTKHSEVAEGGMLSISYCNVVRMPPPIIYYLYILEMSLILLASSGAG